MSNGVPITVVGNLTDDPELRFTPSGAPVAKFTVAYNPRTLDRASGEWRDGEPSYHRVTAWRQLAENIAESLTRGARVVVTGTLAESRWTTPEGEKRSGWEITATALGAELTYATATVRKMAHRTETSPDDPWATASKTRPESAAPAGNGGHDEEPAF